MDQLNRSQRPFVVAIIPARGGSEGVPRKNARPLCGKPLVAYTIEIALRAKGIDRVVVSTEDPEIAEIALSYGADVPFMRPEKLAQSHSNLNDVINHVHYGLKERWHFPNRYILITMLPTSPFKSIEMIEFLVSHAIEGSNPTTVKKIIPRKFHYFEKKNDNTLCAVGVDDAFFDHSPTTCFYKNTGLFLATNWGYPEGRPYYLHVVDDPISLIDIDTWSDFYLAEEVIKEGLFDFGT